MSNLTFCIIFQCIMVALTVTYFIIVGRRRISEITKYLLIIGSFVMVHNFGYLLELMSTDAKQVTMSIRAEYFGGAFVGTYLTIFIVKHCGYRFPKWLQMIALLFDAFVVLSILTSDYNPLFYRSIDFTTEGFIPHAVLDRGPLFSIFAFSLLVQFSANVFFLTRTMIRTKYHRLKNSCRILLIPTLIPPISFFAGMIMPIKDFDFVPCSVAITSFVYGLIILYGKIFDGFDIAYANLVKDLREPVIIVDGEYTFMEANESALKTFPHLRKRAIGEAMERTDDWVKGDKCGEIVRDGHYYAYYKSEIMDGSVKLGYSLLLFDLTEERNKLDEMRRLKADADQANQAKTEFLARMSHEIRTPINAILGMNEVIRRESKDENISRYARDVENSAETLLGIINDILDNTKIESGKMEILPYTYSLTDTFQYIFNMNTLKAQEKELELIMEVDPRLPSKLFGDDLRIRQVLMNLLSNAIKYTVQGKVWFRVRGIRMEDQIKLHYEIEDTGIGIKEEDMSKLFASFERIEESRNRNIQGTGLGMAISKNLLAMMDSKLEVKSEYGKGSRFSFDIIQRIEDSEPVGVFRPERCDGVKKDYKAGFYAPDAKILLVDDNAMNRGVFRNLLKQTAVQIDDADSGKACLDKVTRKPYNIIFMDHMMPGMDGIETLAAMHKLGDYPNKHTPVIMLTANAVTGAREEYLSLGFDDFLTKPVNAAKLEAMIAHFLPQELLAEDRPEDERGTDVTRTVPAETDGKDAAAEEKRNADLPELEEFDWDYALEFVGTKELLLETMDAAYEFFAELSEELGPMAERIEEEGMAGSYRIKVHTLKNTSATIGALLLSKLSVILETAVTQKKFDRVRALNLILLEELEKHMTRMATVLPHSGEPQ